MSPPPGAALAGPAADDGGAAAARRSETYRFDILRFDEASGLPPAFKCYELEGPGHMSVLEALLRIQDEQDPSLSFRCACRGASCGSCAMSVNGRLDLACRLLLGRLRTQRVVLEPLPNARVLKDLVIDMDPFWRRYERVQPWLHAEATAARQASMTEGQREKIEQYFNCVLCAICHGACPVVGRNEQATGPAALAKLYRFVADPRERRGPETLEQEDAVTGVWGCHAIGRCISACPKAVRPADGIAGVRRRLLVHRIRRLVGREHR